MDNPLMKLEGLAKDHPVALWGGVGVGAIAVLVVVIRSKQQAAATPTTSATPSTSGATPTADGTSLTGYDISSMAGIPYGYETSVPYTVMQSAPQQSTTTTATPTETGVVRASQAGTKGASAAYDKNNTGVPLRSGPGSGSVVTKVPFNTSVNITGNSVVGAPNDASGTPNWYPVTFNGTSGYINASDLGNIIIGAAHGMGAGMTRGWASFRHDNPDMLYEHADNNPYLMVM